MPIPSRFNLVIALAGRPDWLVFNTLRGSAALVDEATGRALGRCLPTGKGETPMLRRFSAKGEDNGAVSNTDVLTLATDTARKLIDLGMLVASPEDDSTAARLFLEGYWHPGILKLTLSYTASCQLACTYCFEDGRDLSQRHSPARVEATIAWIETYLEEHPGVKAVHLGLFGGEPLTDVTLANTYIDRLLRLAGSRDLGFTISLTTNGLNLQRELISDWAAKGLEYLRITLDGPPAVHDRRRPYRSGQGSFATILRNICSVKDIDGFGLGISINLDQQNVGQVGELLDILERSGLKEEAEIILEPTFPHYEQAARRNNNQHLDTCSLEIPRAGALVRSALEQVIEKGFRTPLCPGYCAPCNFVRSDNFVVGWDGQLFRCTLSMVCPDMAVGSVEHGVSTDNERWLEAREVTEFCLRRQCAYLPLCAGGCRYWAWCQTGDWKSVHCPLEFWDQVLPLSVAQAFGLRPAPAHISTGRPSQ